MRKCPKCGKELESRVLGPIDVDECETCKGVWLDAGELGKVEEAADPNINWLDFEIWKHPENFKSKESELKCPSCLENTVAIEYGHTEVNINYCPSCRGIWLDKDELPKIIESLENEVAEKTFSDYVHESLREAKEVVTGHESLMSEWKDLSSILRLMQYRLLVEKPKLIDTLTDLNTLNPFK